MRATSRAGASRMSSELGLKAAPRQATFTPGEVAAGEFADEVDGALAATAVDRVDLAQEGHGLADTEGFGPVGEGPDVLGQASAAEPEAGFEEPAADPAVVGRGPWPGGDVGAGRLADFGHRVDVGDLGGQEGVRGDLDQFGGGQVGGDDRGACGDEEGVAGGAAALAPSPRRCRRPAGPGPGCPRRRSPRAGTPGSRPVRRGPRRGRRRVHDPVSRAAVPIGTVDLPTIRHLRVRFRARASTAASTKLRSAASEPLVCGVPTQTKWTSPCRAASAHVGGEAELAGGQGLLRASPPAPVRRTGRMPAASWSILAWSTSTPTTS